MTDFVSVNGISWQTRREYNDRLCQCEGDKMTDFIRVKGIR